MLFCALRVKLVFISMLNTSAVLPMSVDMVCLGLEFIQDEN